MFVYKKRVWAKQCIFVRGKFNKSSLVSVSLWDHARSVSRAGTRTIINLATEDEVRRRGEEWTRRGGGRHQHHGLMLVPVVKGQ